MTRFNSAMSTALEYQKFACCKFDYYSLQAANDQCICSLRATKSGFLASGPINYVIVAFPSNIHWNR